MIFLSILILIVAIALPSINQNIRSILYVRISSIIFIYAGALALNALYIQSIGSGIGIYSGLFQVAVISQLLYDLNNHHLLLTPFLIKPEGKNKKTLVNRVWFGIKTGWQIEVLPNHITKLENNFYIRIFKFIGGFCVFLIISGTASSLGNLILFYIISFVSFIFIIYRLVISFYAIKQWLHNLRSGKFIVRNSPLDLLSTVLKGGVATLRTTTRFTIGTGMTYALCYELDEILISEGKQPYFVPRMRELIRQSGLESQAKTFLDKIGIKDKVEGSESSKIDSYLNTLSAEDKAAFEANTGMKWEDYEKAHKAAMNIKQNSSSNNTTVSSLIDKDDPFNTKKQK